MKLGLVFLIPALATSFAPCADQNHDLTCLLMSDAPVCGVPRGAALLSQGGPPVSKASLEKSQGAIKPFGTFNADASEGHCTLATYSYINDLLLCPHYTDHQDFGIPFV